MKALCMVGGYAGGQVEYVRVPFADVGPIKVPESLNDEQVLFLSDILPTGWQAAVNCNIEPGDTVAVWGCGPVGQFAIRSAYVLGAAFGKGLTMRMGQTHVQKFLPDLLGRIEKGELDPSYVITHRLPLEGGAAAYKTFRDKEDDCIKVVLRPSTA